MRSKIFYSVSILIILAGITSCGGSNGGGGGTTTPPGISVTATAASPTVVPGGTDQFSAHVTGTSSTAVTWAIGASDPGSIDANGLYTAPGTDIVTAPATIHVTATLSSDTTKTGTASATVVQLTGITISPIGPVLQVNDTKSFAATGTFTDGTNSSTADWTNEVTWSSSNSAVASIGSSTGSAHALAAGVTTIKATDAAGGTIKGKTVLDVTTGAFSSGLSGSYVFSVTHAGTRGQAYAAGVFVAGASGQITGGTESFNGPQATASNVSISAGVGCGGTPTTDSCYEVNGDGRGTVHLTTSRGTDTFAIILSSDGLHGQLIVSGTLGVEVGKFEKQSATTLGNGTYSLLLGGMDGTLLNGSNATQKSEALAGQFKVAAGAISNAVLDVNDNGAIDGGAACGSTCPPPGSALPFTATFTQAGSNGRGTITITPTGIPAGQLVSGSWNFDFFVVSANKIVLIQTDAQGAAPTIAALAGTAEKQSFASGPSLSGANFVFLVERSAAQGLFGSGGQWKFGATKLTGEFDANCLQTAPQCQATTTLTTITPSDYTIDATGRGTVTISATRSYVFYLIGDPTAGSAKMYLLETDNKPNAGAAWQQTAGPSFPTSGTLAFNLAQLATGGNDASYSGFLSVNGATISGVADSNVASSFVEAPDAVEVDVTGLSSLDASFRGTLSLNIPNDPTPYAFYLISPTQMVIFGTNSALTGIQAVDGTVEVQ